MFTQGVEKILEKLPCLGSPKFGEKLLNIFDTAGHLVIYKLLKIKICIHIQ